MGYFFLLPPLILYAIIYKITIEQCSWWDISGNLDGPDDGLVGIHQGKDSCNITPV
jgi:hypothetical protein